METMQFCQSCGMPMSNEVWGTNADGSKTAEYCSYCFADGKFVQDCSMEQMIAACVAPMVQANPEMTPEKASAMMGEFFPTLKRWKA